MAERDLNARIRAAILHRDPVRVENTVGPGTPDIEYIGGWIESKLLKAWPKRPDTVVRLGHYRPDQRGWHVRRRKAGGRVHVVLQIENDVLVFDALEAAKGLGFWTRAQMHKMAVCAMYPWNTKTFRDFIDGLNTGEVR